jgi:hypothetical protein
MVVQGQTKQKIKRSENVFFDVRCILYTIREQDIDNTRKQIQQTIEQSDPDQTLWYEKKISSFL